MSFLINTTVILLNVELNEHKFPQTFSLVQNLLTSVRCYDYFFIIIYYVFMTFLNYKLQIHLAV